jgi:hypothetical protein
MVTWQPGLGRARVLAKHTAWTTCHHSLDVACCDVRVMSGTPYIGNSACVEKDIRKSFNPTQLLAPTLALSA